MGAAGEGLEVGRQAVAPRDKMSPANGKQNSKRGPVDSRSRVRGIGVNWPGVMIQLGRGYLAFGSQLLEYPWPHISIFEISSRRQFGLPKFWKCQTCGLQSAGPGIETSGLAESGTSPPKSPPPRISNSTSFPTSPAIE